MSDVPNVPIHHAPKSSPRKRMMVEPTVDRLASHAETPESVATKGERPETPPARRSHALDFALVPSKIVKTTEGAVIAAPDGVTMLPEGDIAHRLPVGAKIEKRGPAEYRSTQLNATESHPDTVHTTAIDAIAAFAPHFHPRNG